MKPTYASISPPRQTGNQTLSAALSAVSILWKLVIWPIPATAAPTSTSPRTTLRSAFFRSIPKISCPRSAIGLLEQPRRDDGPAPALLDGAAGGETQLAPSLGWERENCGEPLAQRARVARRERQEGRRLRADFLADPCRHLGEPGVGRDDGQHAGRGGLGRDHPERLGKDRGHDRDVAERQQVAQVAMLERPGEEGAERSPRLELLAEVAEADDDGARGEPGDRLEQHLDALVLDQLPEVEDRRPPPVREEPGEAPEIALVRKPLLAVARIRRIVTRFLEERGERLHPRLGTELVHVDARRHDLDPIEMADDLLEHLADVLGACVDDLRPGERLGTPAGEIGPPAHRVLELRPVRLDAETHPARGADRRAEQDVVREDDVRRAELAQDRGVRLDVRVPLSRREIPEQPRLEPLVAVEDEDGQQAARQLGHDDPRAAEVVLLRVPLLADDRDVVAPEAPLARERPGVDVRPGAAEQVPVPEQNSQVR